MHFYQEACVRKYKQAKFIVAMCIYARMLQLGLYAVSDQLYYMHYRFVVYTINVLCAITFHYSRYNSMHR